MLIIPHSAALRFNKRPYVTYGVMLICVIIFYFQATNSAQINSALFHYCESIHNPELQASLLDVLAQNRNECVYTLDFLHERIDHGSLGDIEQAIREDYRNDYSIEDKVRIVQLIRRHLEAFQKTAPASLTGNLMQYPDELNPLPMITSSLAHADWGHIVFNLVFFLAFAPAIEVLIDNKLRYVGILIAIALITGIAYGLSVVVSGAEPVPTLGLSGVVMAMIGMSAFLMPHAKIRVFVWFIAIIRNFYIPAWVLAVWYIGWDVLDMFISDDHGGVNLVAHVSGGISGYLVGFFWLKDRREAVRDELEDEIEYMRAKRSVGGATFSYSGGRNEMANRQREKQAGKDHQHYMSELYRYVTTQRDSDAIVLMLKDYEIQSASVELFEDLYERVKDWGDSRLLLCLGRLIVNLLIQQRKYPRALLYVERCQAISEEFVLADPNNVLLLAAMARDNHQYPTAYLLVRDSFERYGEALDVGQCQLMEIELLWQNLNKPDEARETVRRYLGLDTLPSRAHLLDIARLLQETP